MPTQADNSLIRAQSSKVYDDEAQQKFELDARKDEKYGGTGGKYATPRIQDYGRTGHPPKGSQGMVTTLDGNSDKAMVMGLEHPDFRPRGLAEGELKDYTKWGDSKYYQEEQWYTKVGPCEIWYKKSGEIKFKVGTAVILMQMAGGIVHLNPPE